MNAGLYQQIQQFYDASSGLWEQLWGPHMHHGYYGREGGNQVERRQAQVDLIEALLNAATDKLGVNLPDRISSFLDVGCGIGGSTLYLAQKFNASGTGITLSPVQAARASARAAAAHLSPQTTFLVADALNTPFADNSFDLVWSLESGEHMPDKHKLLQECYRVLKPGGTLILATWCHRPTAPTGLGSIGLSGPLQPSELRHLKQIYRVYHLPYVISLPEYEAIARAVGFLNLHTADWSDAVAPFWDDVIRSAFSPAAIFGLLRAGLPTIKGALAMGLMKNGYRRGLIRYGVLWATKGDGVMR
ncbi:MAG TPA: methyltransferase domain-containing protein [Oscillatoriaceae cyanobacterium M33_DOE_052]|uniref:Methyltransferase domain-containing protein n=1 Tax=Planktothricoides sp. SpSt-374 TaxID=2282167 RepID=A0A7C3ZXT3_9CYAN|nr:methyltransferase domain-containing protein [Oscillatoriaceae cyanobacterium M33_DOE_052]